MTSPNKRASTQVLPTEELNVGATLTNAKKARVELVETPIAVAVDDMAAAAAAVDTTQHRCVSCLKFDHSSRSVLCTKCIEQCIRSFDDNSKEVGGGVVVGYRRLYAAKLSAARAQDVASGFHLLARVPTSAPPPKLPHNEQHYCVDCGAHDAGRGTGAGCTLCRCDGVTYSAEDRTVRPPIVGAQFRGTTYYQPRPVAVYPVHAVEEEGKAVWKWKASEWHEDGVTAHLDWMAVERYPVAPVANAGANYIWVDVKTELPANRVTMQVRGAFNCVDCTTLCVDRVHAQSMCAPCLERRESFVVGREYTLSVNATREPAPITYTAMCAGVTEAEWTKTQWQRIDRENLQELRSVTQQFRKGVADAKSRVVLTKSDAPRLLVD